MKIKPPVSLTILDTILITVFLGFFGFCIGHRNLVGWKSQCFLVGRASVFFEEPVLGMNETSVLDFRFGGLCVCLNT